MFWGHGVMNFPFQNNYCCTYFWDTFKLLGLVQSYFLAKCTSTLSLYCFVYPFTELQFFFRYFSDLVTEFCRWVSYGIECRLSFLTVNWHIYIFFTPKCCKLYIYSQHNTVWMKHVHTSITLMKTILINWATHEKNIRFLSFGAHVANCNVI